MTENSFVFDAANRLLASIPRENSAGKIRDWLQTVYGVADYAWMSCDLNNDTLGYIQRMESYIAGEFGKREADLDDVAIGKECLVRILGNRMPGKSLNTEVERSYDGS